MAVRRSFILGRGDAQYLLVPGTFTLGRSSTCDLVIDDPLVSRVHAVIRVGIANAALEDAGSANGVFVNGVRIDEPRPLVAGDCIGIGAQQIAVSSKDRSGKRMSRDTTMPKAQAAAVEAAFAATPVEHPKITQLTQREREVLAMVARGYTTREIAEQLRLSSKTIESYRARLSEKIGLRTRADIVRFALETGLLRP